jgi:hypothetical protein
VSLPPDALLAAWAWAFGRTLLVEVPLVLLLVWALRDGERPTLSRAALAAMIGSAVTHPLLWFAWSRVVHDYSSYLLSGELLVVAIEALLLWWLARPLPLRRCLGISLVVNGASIAVGWGWNTLSG